MQAGGSEAAGSENSTQRLRDLEALYSVAGAIHDSWDLDEVLHHGLDTALELFHLSSGVLRLLDAPTGALTVAASSGLSPELEAELKPALRIGEGGGSLVCRDRPVTVVEDLADSDYAGSIWVRHGYRTLVTATLQCRRMLLGSLTLAAEQETAFSQADRELLAALTNQIALAVAKVELYAGARRKIEHLATLHQCSRDIGPTLELPEVLSLTAQRMAQLLRLERTAVLNLAPETGELVGVVSFGFPEGEVQALRAPINGLSAAGAVLWGAQTWLSNAPAEEGLLPEPFVQRAGVTSALGIPLTVQDEPLGLLVGDRSEQPLRLSPDEMDLAMIFANQASVRIARARALAEATGAQAKFRDLLELAPDAILQVSREGRIGLVNSQAEKMFGYHREELIGQPIETLIPARYHAQHLGHRADYHREPQSRPMGSGLDLFA